MPDLKEITAQLQAIQEQETRAINASRASEELEQAKIRIFGKKGSLSAILRSMSGLRAEERPEAGKVANDVKEALAAVLEQRTRQVAEEEMNRAISRDRIDVTLPGIKPPLGSLHPITRTLREITDIFGSMGFEVELGPDIETDYYNFEALNFPQHHPARDMHDTFYLAGNMLLRTHTSPVQIHTMESRKPPLAIIAPGNCYRCDADTTHSPMFHQVEGFMVDTNIRFSDLKGILESFIHRMFGEDIAYRLRPSFFPFTEPSAEVDIFFEAKRPDGTRVRRWMEILGSGMIHPNVLANCDIDPEKYSGFAFGMGVERLAMLKYGITNLYSLYENNLRFLKQF